MQLKAFQQPVETEDATANVLCVTSSEDHIDCLDLTLYYVMQLNQVLVTMGCEHKAERAHTLLISTRYHLKI